MNFLSNQMKSKVNIGARIYAALLLVYNTMTLISYYNILQTPDVLRTVSENMSLQMSEEQIQSILAEIPMQLVISGVVIVGLVMLILNQRWGFIPFATIPTANALMALLNRDFRASLSALIPVVLMAVILSQGSPRGKRQSIAAPPNLTMD